MGEFLDLGLALGPDKKPTTGSPPPPSYDADADLWFAAVVANGGAAIDAPTKQIISDFYAGLKTDGVYAKTDYMGLRCAPDGVGARIELKTKTLVATVGGGLTHVASRGHQGNDTNGELLTGYNPFTFLGQYVRNSCGLISYVNATNSDVGSAKATIGKVSNTDAFIRPRNATTNNFYGRVQGSNAKDYAAQATRLGFRAIVRTSSTLTKGYGADGLQSGTNDTQASSDLTNEAFREHRLQSTYGGDRIAFTAYVGGLSDAEVLAFRNRIVTMLTALGAN